MRGSHAAWARRVPPELRIDLNFAALDVEYATASAWLGDSKISGIDTVHERSPDRPWFDMGCVAKEVGVSRVRLDRQSEPLNADPRK